MYNVCSGDGVMISPESTELAGQHSYRTRIVTLRDVEKTLLEERTHGESSQ